MVPEVSEVMTFLLDAYQEALDVLAMISVWVTLLVSPSAIVWYALGLLTLPLLQFIRIRYAFWRMKSRLARKVNGKSGRLISSAMRILSRTYPKAPIQIRREETENVLDILSKIVEIADESSSTDWKRLWSKVDSSWLERFVSKGRMIEEPLLQEALATAFVREAIRPGRLGHREIDVLAAISVQDWRTFTAICGFACCIGGRITPVIFNYEEDVYRKAGLSAEMLDDLVAAGVITQGGTGDSYTLRMPARGLRVTYFDEEELTLRPLPAPTPRKYLGRTLTQPHPLDKNLDVGVVDFTQLGRTLGFLAPCSKVDGFTNYLRCRWEVYLHDQESIS